MRTNIVVLLFSLSLVAAGPLTSAAWGSVLEMAQSPSVMISPNGVVTLPKNQDYRTDKQRDRHQGSDRLQRYVCVVPPPQSSDRRRPYVCNADSGRIGGRCRCPGTVGNGNLDFAR